MAIDATWNTAPRQKKMRRSSIDEWARLTEQPPPARSMPGILAEKDEGIPIMNLPEALYRSDYRTTMVIDHLYLKP
jgi:hypothetical protein